MTKELKVLIGGIEIGVLTEKVGKYEFAYDDAWMRRGAGSFPMSLSMPKEIKVHKGAVVANFLHNLLPDNDRTLGEWSKRFHVSALNPFAMLAHVGEDCPGAVQIVRPERVDSIRNKGAVKWIDEAEVARRLRNLRTNEGASAGRESGNEGQFSLAGAQPKTALHFVDGKWGVPSGRIPTTHILKPPAPHLAGHAENEHICLKLSSRLGLRTAASEVMRFDGETAIVVTRFDRMKKNDRIQRLHQEDCCQATGKHPSFKYENEKGPGIKTIVSDVLVHCEARKADVKMLFHAVMLSEIIGATDQHAKNYSVQIVPGPRVRLAPLYDIASYFPYASGIHDVRLAMKVGGKYRTMEIMPRHWESEAKSCGVDPDEAIAWHRRLVAEIPDALSQVVAEERSKGLDHPVLDMMLDAVARNCARLEAIYGAADATEDAEMAAPSI